MKLLILFILLFIFSFTILAEEIDSTVVTRHSALDAESLETVLQSSLEIPHQVRNDGERDVRNDETVAKNLHYAPLTKSPTKAMFYSLGFPGVGQIYVENYWRAAIFSVGAGVLWYNIVSNHKTYKNEQKIMNSIEDKTSQEYLLARGRREVAVDNRDLSALYLIGVYALSMIDAYASAHLYDFTVEQNMNFNFAPNILSTGNIYWKFGLNYRF